MSGDASTPPTPGAAPASSPATSSTRTSLPTPGSLFIWLFIQVAALVLAASDVSLAAHYPQPAHAYALHLLVIIQIIASAALFPVLLRNWVASVMVICSAWPCLFAAGFLSAAPTARIVAVGAFVTLWLCLIALLACALGRSRASLIAASIIGSAVVGDVLLPYLRAEFAHSVVARFNLFSHVSPIAMALQTIAGESRIAAWGGWMIVVAIAFLVRLGMHRHRQRALQLVSNSA